VSTPVRAFITFEDAEGYNLAKSLTHKGGWLNTDKTIKVMGSDILFKQAPEPSNLNWLRQSMNKSTRNLRKLITLLIVILIFSIQIIVFFTVNKKLNEIQDD